ncbi:hypothetical protein EYF80_039821 [Liparis tanakae]|uniref:Uncharacterized protein n=1 Tax=Liparis tanakae TaxID=230148 RepID=A0A4Z2GAN7_9TELE|nr:hypothetical protein EYF80_039821 [Liparis tanakae]
MTISPPRIHAPKSLFLKEIRVSMTAATRGRLGSAFCPPALRLQPETQRVPLLISYLHSVLGEGV